MPFLPGNYPNQRNLWVVAASFFISFLAGSLILSADTPGELRTAEVGTCYCHCAEASAHHACVKMCETPKYAAKRWAATCVKPRFKRPAENRDAGPRFEHPGRNERAQNATPTAAS